MAVSIERVIAPRPRDIGGFEVRRILPAGGRQMVGPFIFYDHLGPAEFAPGKGLDVRPHPHIGLATVTYLFDGEIMHRDNLGYVQPIRPGDVNWMTAGSGIVHSERTPPEVRARGSHTHGVQSWVALPKSAEHVEPAFFHHPAASLPLIERDGVTMRVIAGTAFGRESPVKTFSSTLYVDVRMKAGSELTLDDEHAERAVHVAAGRVSVAGQSQEGGTMLVFDTGGDISIRAETDARVMLVGGAPMDGPRVIWWNFVASSQELIEQAKKKWVAQGYAKVPGETEFIPLPDR